eukprot:Lankesteria_metandrocarpae@DN2545_c0_g1_i3.p1
MRSRSSTSNQAPTGNRSKYYDNSTSTVVDNDMKSRFRNCHPLHTKFISRRGSDACKPPSSRRLYKSPFYLLKFGIHWLYALLRALIVVTPTMAFLGYAYVLYCSSPDDFPTPNKLSSIIEIHHWTANEPQINATIKQHTVVDIFHNILPLTIFMAHQVVRNLCAMLNIPLVLTLPYSATSTSTIGISTSRPSWCSQGVVPSIYKHIQSSVWHVRPFGYWKISKIDRFMISVPFYLIATTALFSRIYIRSSKKCSPPYSTTQLHDSIVTSSTAFQLHHRDNDRDRSKPRQTLHSVQSDIMNDQREDKDSSKSSVRVAQFPLNRWWTSLKSFAPSMLLTVSSKYYPCMANPLTGELALLTFVGGIMLFLGNCEVFIRMVTCCPFFYYHCACFLLAATYNNPGLNKSGKTVTGVKVAPNESDPDDNKYPHESAATVNVWRAVGVKRIECVEFVTGGIMRRHAVQNCLATAFAFWQGFCFCAGCLLFPKFVTWT